MTDMMDKDREQEERELREKEERERMGREEPSAMHEREMEEPGGGSSQSGSTSGDK